VAGGDGAACRRSNADGVQKITDFNRILAAINGASCEFRSGLYVCSGWAPEGKAGYTVGQVFWWAGEVSPTTIQLKHEYQHFLQWLRYGPKFVALYAAEVVRSGGSPLTGGNPLKNGFEIQAGLSAGYYLG
jgi:hypothetical protein